MWGRLGFIAAQHVIASTALALGLLVNVAGAVLAAAGDNNIAPYTTIGSNAAVVATLIFFAKEFVKGRIVAEPIDDLLRESAQREERWLQYTRDRAEADSKLVAAGQEREDRLWTLIPKP